MDICTVNPKKFCRISLYETHNTIFRYATFGDISTKFIQFRQLTTKIRQAMASSAITGQC